MSDGEPVEVAARRFSGRMARIAGAAALLLAVLPTALFAWSEHATLAARAHAHAEALGHALAPLAARQPVLWRYNLPKLLTVTSGQRGLAELGAVEVVDCDGQALVDGRALWLGSGAPTGPTRRAPVLVDGTAVAWVRVTADASRAWYAAGLVGMGAAAVAGTLGLLLWAFPSRAVRQQARALGATMGRLRAAEAELREANQELSVRVEHAVARARGLSERLLQTVEQERRRVARDLHDGVGQALTALQIDLQLAEAELEAGAPGALGRARAQAAAVLDEIRNVARDLRPLELERRGLAGALAALCERFELRTQVATSFRTEGEVLDDERLALALYRIAQEALSNVSRHAAAEEVGVVLRVEPDHVRLQISDDGQGLPPDWEARGGSGLSGMRERAAFASGDLRVDSRPGEGLALVVTLPRRRDADDDALA